MDHEAGFMGNCGLSVQSEKIKV